MTGDAEVTDTEHHQIIDFIVRRCSTDHKVFRQSYIIHTTTWESYRARILDLRILVNDISASFTFPVYIRESITDIPKEHMEE